MFYEQLADFAHQQQAIVIVASHETLPEDYADQILTINNRQLVPQSGTKLFNRAIPESMAGQPTASAVTYRSDLSNKQALVYDNYQSAKKLPIGFLVIVTVMLAVASIVLNVPQILASQQQRELNQATDNSLFVTNNTLGTGSHQDLDPFRNLTIKQIQKIKKMPGITSVQPYYTFLSYGLTKENVRQPVPKGSNFSLGGKSYHVDETFSIQPIYKSDLTKKYLYANGHPAKVGTNFIVSQDFLEKNHISTKSAMGKQVAFEVYIPYAQYLSESELPTNNKKKVAIDGNIYVQQPLAATITGVYASNYPYDRSEQGNAFFMDDASMTTLLHSAIRANTTSDQIFQGFKQQPFGYSALRFEAKSYNDMVSMTKTIKSSSGFYSVSSVAQNVASLNATVQKAKNGTRQIALLFIMAKV
ncbi:ABC transporter permease [Lacticaseibacillus paracasei]|nr:ABC transporter permease [Lacticaseibacillus paracasei]MCZ2753450.1 ABC transporter permease [Lacticaseibacillus paracasei]MCZ2763895.1 ABC transporter permease [Lacticaseibacillus paracasei]MCZ2772311.1 ABC transporter permease [Lacticaseibacillus paracasei]MDB7805839.1 ABC transporter permease [Lacticaseibacillus paracasei]